MIFALIDCNSFYCSCQRTFDPSLKRSAVVVLSNNDGCAIARTAEAKKLGIKMGDPWHLNKNSPKLSGVRWFSSNYALYADMSRRVYQVLLNHSPYIEPYSIDEMFMDLSGFPGPLMPRCEAIRRDVESITKIPTCIGWGPTKTIAKLANYIAKDRPELEGLCDLTDIDTRERYYRNLPVSEIWGIGRRLEPKMNKLGIRTIAQFVSADPGQIRQLMSVIGVRLQAELKGVSCLPISEIAGQRKGLTSSRSFGKPITSFDEMKEAVATFIFRACEKLREEKLDAAHLSVFIQTNVHQRQNGWYGNQCSSTIEPTDDVFVLCRLSFELLKAIWKPGFRYAKAGVLLNDLSPAGAQKGLFSTRPEKKTALLEAMDVLNSRYGRGTIAPLCTGVSKGWKPRQNMLSPRYTTNFSEIMEARTY